MEPRQLPGHELVLRGLADVDAVAEPLLDAEHRLYALLAAKDSHAAHGRYNALVRQLVSFERAADARAR